ncbi:hypothetical protein GS909_18610 [Rhodococcus hoagii]|nr:hypothetical protein [Prescottella equi]
MSINAAKSGRNPIELSFSHQRQFTEADTIGEPREEVLNRNGQLSFWLGCDARSSGSAYSIRVVTTKLGDHFNVHARHHHRTPTKAGEAHDVERLTGAVGLREGACCSRMVGGIVDAVRAKEPNKLTCCEA